MSVWMNNLKTALENKEVLILHGNVRDRYIHPQKGVVYDSLTELLEDVSKELSIFFSRLIYYDPIGREKSTARSGSSSQDEMRDEFSGTAPDAKNAGSKADPARFLAKSLKYLGDTTQNTALTIFYLDKLAPYKQGYQAEERDIILWIEKIIENITPNNRLVMVALQDTMIPVEFYTNSPKVAVLPIAAPDKKERALYLSHRLGKGFQHNDFTADLCDGLFLRDMDKIIRGIANNPQINSTDLRKLVDRYRIGEGENPWSEVDIEKLNGAFRWFVDQKGVKAQDEAVKKVIETLLIARAGLAGLASGTISRPKGVLFFCGPTGVGKTYLAKKLAQFLFSSEDAFIRFDMSEFKEAHTVSKLIGSSPGYVGFERGGQLTSAIRQKPFSVVLGEFKQTTLKSHRISNCISDSSAGFFVFCCR